MGSRGRSCCARASSSTTAPRSRRMKPSSLVCRIFPREHFDAANPACELGQLEDAPLPAKMTAAEYRRILTDQRHVYVKRSLFSLRFYGLATRTKPLDDRRVRQALNH